MRRRRKKKRKKGQLIMEAGPTDPPTNALTPGSRNIKGGKQKKSVENIIKFYAKKSMVYLDNDTAKE